MRFCVCVFVYMQVLNANVDVFKHGRYVIVYFGVFNFCVYLVSDFDIRYPTINCCIPGIWCVPLGVNEFIHFFFWSCMEGCFCIYWLIALEMCRGSYRVRFMIYAFLLGVCPSSERHGDGHMLAYGGSEPFSLP